MSVLFLTRKYPPSLGGMETFSAELISRYPHPHIAITESGKNILLSMFLLFFRALPHLRAASIIHVGDAVLAPIGTLLHLISKKPVVVTLHGLELTSNYGSDWYHLAIRQSIPHIAHWVAVSTYTAKLAEHYGIDHKNTSVITHGSTNVIYAPDQVRASREALEKIYPNIISKKIILSVGRLVQRKGIGWFITYVLPHLPADVVLCVVSDGPERKSLAQLAEELSIQDRVIFCGKIVQQELEHWYNGCDVFIFPNIPTPYDVEGFGLAPLKAATHGIRVYASDIHGIPEALGHGKYGTLLPTLNAPAWKEALINALTTTHQETAKKQIMESAQKSAQWEKKITEYATLFQRIA